MDKVTQEKESIIDFLGTVEILSAFERAELTQLLEQAQSQFFKFGDTVCETGDQDSGLYVIKSGAVRLFSESEGKETSMGVRKNGEVFSELSVMSPFHLDYSVRCSAKTELLCFPREAFTALLQANTKAREFVVSYVAISSAGGLVTRLFNLKGKVDKKEIEHFVRSVGIKRIAAGKTILTQDSSEDRRLYVVRQGEVKIVRREEDIDYPLASLLQGEIFGERACLLRQEQLASAVAQAVCHRPKLSLVPEGDWPPLRLLQLPALPGWVFHPE